MLGETALRGLMSYGVRQAFAATRNDAQEIDEMTDWPRGE